MKKVGAILLALTSLLAFQGCDLGVEEYREVPYDQVMILYSVGHNTIDSSLKTNISQLMGGYLPERRSHKAMLLVGNFYDNETYSDKSGPFVARLYSSGGEAVMDTLMRFPSGDRLTSIATMDSVFRYINNVFRSYEYGMVYSSHGTGWLPEGYYDPYGKGQDYFLSPQKARALIPEGAHLYVEPEPVPGKPEVKSIGHEVYQKGSLRYSYEMKVQDFVKAIPFKLDYLIIDACFMGGIEVAYELKDKVGTLAFSASEVLSEGMDYTNMGNRLLGGPSPDIKGVAMDYYDKYKDRTGSKRTAVVSVIDCSKLGTLAQVCSDLFGKYRKQIAAVDESLVQGYFVNEDRWFYDLEDILVQSGATSGDLGRLKDALSSCVIYKASTPELFAMKEIRTHCGFSTYLPNMGEAYLDDFYKTFQWNIATGFVE